MTKPNKGSWYKLLIDKMDQSIENRYFFEAIFIEYMLIDDRVKALARLAGVELLRPDGNPKMIGQLLEDLKMAKSKQTAPQWQLLNVGIPLGEKELLKAMKKQKYPKELVYQCTHVPRVLINYERNGKSGKYLSKYGAVNAPMLAQLGEWVTGRNHWMHAAGNDALDLEAYEADITPLAVDGASFARELCAVTDRIKRGVARERKRAAENNGA